MPWFFQIETVLFCCWNLSLPYDMIWYASGHLPSSWCLLYCVDYEFVFDGGVVPSCLYTWRIAGDVILPREVLCWDACLSLSITLVWGPPTPPSSSAGDLIENKSSRYRRDSTQFIPNLRILAKYISHSTNVYSHSQWTIIGAWREIIRQLYFDCGFWLPDELVRNMRWSSSVGKRYHHDIIASSWSWSYNIQ